MSRTARALVGFALIAAGGLEPSPAVSAIAGDDGWAVTGGVETSPTRLFGGEFELERRPLATVAGGDFLLSAAPSAALAQAPDGALCFCAGQIFADGFESHDTSAWSLDAP